MKEEAVGGRGVSGITAENSATARLGVVMIRRWEGDKTLLGRSFDSEVITYFFSSFLVGSRRPAFGARVIASFLRLHTI